ncbi:response regulator [Waterburya agarophytonicola K14]|uniref:Chemotaxis protein CheA n=1 Tax=Waterburya agarophytonicola KI4 TaxID=2874699 RepID=A0A964FGK3_9CYAN|nr:response regulator [Waterburya agarophytonicola]MCC0176593.1 response regulator [Waterburya agarophytonicola KI4]
MYIDDEELRELYKTSSSEHISKLESELMILEKNPQDSSAMEEFLREAHTLKGDSRMLGLNDIEMLVHQLEDCVEGIKAGKGELTAELCDRLYQGIDAINQLSHEAITGESVEINATDVLAALMGSSNISESGNDSGLDLFDDDDDSDFFSSDRDSQSSLFDDDDDDSDFFSSDRDSQSSLFDDDEQDEQKQDIAQTKPSSNTVSIENSNQPIKVATPARDYKIDTIRVEPQKLDILMTQASELAVTKLRISQQMTEIDRMLALFESWNKYDYSDDDLFAEVESSLTAEEIQPLRYFYNHARQYLNSFSDLANNLKTRASEDVASLSIISDRLETGIQGLRQLPLSTVFNIYPRMVRDLARQQGKEIEFIIEGGDTKADKRILEEIKDPLLHLIRNAVDHGIETPEERIIHGKPPTATIILRGYQTGSSIGIELIDDGRGLDLASIRNTALRRNVRTSAQLAAMSESEIQSLIFASGFSTRTEVTELSGRGVGLDVVRANVEKLKGSIQVISNPGNGCKFQVRLNTSLATTKVLIVDLNRTRYALPLEFIQTMITLPQTEIYKLEDKPTITFEDLPISLTWLASLLQIPTPENYTQGKNNLLCIILQIDDERFGVIVDDLVDQQDIVIKPQSKLLKRIPNIAGATILGSGEVCMILNPPDLLHSLRSGNWRTVVRQTESESTKNKLLLVEDSIIIRTQMQRLLKGAGYDVIVAENGLIGLQKVQEHEFDIVLSDVEMPQMSGLEMTANIRQQSQYDRLPIVLITTLASPEDKRRGKEAGANAYLTKGDFDQQLLFQTLGTLINS